MATKPTININFKQLATTLIERSQRGTAIMLLKESKSKAVITKVYKNVADVDSALYSTQNLDYIKACLSYAPYELVVISTNSSYLSDFTPALQAARNTGWIAAPGIVDGSTLLVKEYNPGLNKNELGVTGGVTWTNTGNVTVSYKGVTYKTALEITGSTNIKFTAPKKGKATLILYSTSNGGKTIAVDGVTHNFDITSPPGLVTLELSAGEHKITQASSTLYLFGIYFEYSGIEVQADLASWIKSMENEGKTYKGIGPISGKDCKHYVYFNQTAYDNDGYTVKAEDYLANLLGIMASCNITKGCTNFLCSDLSRVDDVENIDTAISKGQLVLANDVGGVRIVTGINSLITLNGNTATEDMQYVETVEAMDLIRDDIRDVFKNTYLGKYRNKYEYQLLFLSAVNQYYSQLANEDILDSNFDNRAEIDVELQRSAWLGVGKSEAADWDDEKVKQMSFKRSVFITNKIKILNSMENLTFTVVME